MSSLDTLQERLLALQETTAQLKDLIDRLTNLKFQPGSVPLDTTENGNDENVATELSAEIGQILREEEEELELLQEEIIDLRGGKAGSEAEHRKVRLQEGTRRLGVELKTARTAFRKAQLQAAHNIKAAQKLERELLLASYAAAASVPASPTSSSPSPSDTEQKTQDEEGDANQNPRDKLFTPRDRRRLLLAKHPSPQEGDQVLDASSDVTLALRRTHALIAGEVQKSAFASQTLAESSAALAELQRNYEGLEGLLSKSKDLVSTLLTTQKSDTWYLQSAFRLLLITLAWLVFRRFLYGPLWWMVWLPLKMTYKTGRAVTHLGAKQSTVAEMKVVVPDGGGGRTVMTTVVGMGGEDDAAMPTIQVGKPMTRNEEEGNNKDSLVEELGRMVEDTLDQREREAGAESLGSGDVEEEVVAEGEQAERVEPNPKKRMWEEEVREPGPQAVRDEL